MIKINFTKLSYDFYAHKQKSLRKSTKCKEGGSVTNYSLGMGRAKAFWYATLLTDLWSSLYGCLNAAHLIDLWPSLYTLDRDVWLSTVLTNPRFVTKLAHQKPLVSEDEGLPNKVMFDLRNYIIDKSMH